MWVGPCDLSTHAIWINYYHYLSMSNRKQEQALINLLWDSENANYFRSQPNPEETWHNAPEFVIRKSIPYSNRSKKQNIGQVRTNSNTLCLYKSSQLKRAALNPKKSQSARTATPDKRQRSPMNLNTEAQEQHRGSFSAAVREIKGIEDRQKARRYIIK